MPFEPITCLWDTGRRSRTRAGRTSRVLILRSELSPEPIRMLTSPDFVASTPSHCGSLIQTEHYPFQEAFLVIPIQGLPTFIGLLGLVPP